MFNTLASSLQGYQVSLKSTRGPIDVFLCPDDSSGVCSPVTGSSPSKPNADPSLVQPPAQTADQSQARTSTTALEVGLSSPASTSSTVTAASQQDPSTLVLGGDTGECSRLSEVFRNYLGDTRPKILKGSCKKALSGARRLWSTWIHGGRRC